ncbi:VOC family protein [Streptomyces sp. NPDC051219]|uniref:VOC family protein n=1 Tax=Streptomyces sp. NPDC051219 TaxID=3155283 RepID=UPI003438924C
MLTTRYVTGAPNWIDLGTPDVDGANTFYGGLFGWEFLPAGPDAAGYGMFRLGDKTVAGGSPRRASPRFPSRTRGSYTVVRPAGSDDDAAFGDIVPLATDPTEAKDGAYWLPYFEVADCDATAANAEELGGKVRTAPMDMEGVGRFAKLADLFGARFAVIKSAYAER